MSCKRLLTYTMLDLFSAGFSTPCYLWVTDYSQTSVEFCNFCVCQEVCEVTGGAADSALSSLWGISLVKNAASLLSFIFHFSSASFEVRRMGEGNRPKNVSVGETEQLSCNCIKRHQKSPSILYPSEITPSNIHYAARAISFIGHS